jgi:hypothetical protein
MTPDDIRRLMRRDLDGATLATVAKRERDGLLCLAWLVRRGHMAPAEATR